MKKLLLFFFLGLSVFSFSQETLNAMFYNLFKFPNSLPNNREIILRDILDEYPPDLLMVCELVTESAANLILNTSFQNQADPFGRADFIPDLTKPSDPVQTMVFYNKRKLTLLDQQNLLTVYRDINQYSFQLNVVESEPIYLEVFVAHLKSSTGTANQQIRLQMVQVVTAALEALTKPNTFVLFSGDFNFYKSSEPGYQEILSPTNAIRLLDPLNAPGNWQNNPDFSYLHTQSTRVSNAGFGGGTNAGAGGGLDDRFDFIMMSENFQTSSIFSYVNETYKAVGNNGNCLDKDVKDPTCIGEFSPTLRNDLYYMSDHLPVFMQFQVNDTFLSTKTFDTKPDIWFESSNVSDKDIIIGINQEKKYNNKVYIYNSLGQLIHSSEINKQDKVRILTHSFSSGVYYIKTNSNETTLKFIKK